MTSASVALDETSTQTPMSKGWTRLRALRGVAGIAALVLLYELSRLIGVLPPSVAPGTPEIAVAVYEGLLSGVLTAAIVATLLAWALGVVAALLIGVPIGLAMGFSKWVDGTLQRIVEFFRPIPVVALVPIAIILFGVEIAMQVLLVAIACMWPVLIATRAGVRAVDPLQIDTAKTFGLARLTVIRRVVLPASIPTIATGLRVAASLGVVVAVSVELITGSPGLGAQLVSEQRVGDSASVWACIVLTGILGVVINLILGAMENYFVGWQEHSTEGRL